MITMGSSQDVMQSFVSREIRTHFSQFDGWSCEPAESPASRDSLYLISRDVRGKKETIALQVSFDEEPSVTALLAVSSRYTGRRALKGQYLLVPRDADVSAVNAGIRILSMSMFGFTDGQLIWLTKKKGARHYAQPEAPAKAVATPACETHAA